MNCFYIDFPVDITSDTRSKYSDDLDSKSTAFISSDDDQYSDKLKYLLDDAGSELDFEYDDEVEEFERTEDWDCNDWDDPYFSKGSRQGATRISLSICCSVSLRYFKRKPQPQL